MAGYGAFMTGAEGFLGWHLRARLWALHGLGTTSLDLRTGDVVGKSLRDHDESSLIFHLAGVNRADTNEEVERGNQDLAALLAAQIRAAGRAVHVVYANSIHSSADTPYGRGKAGAAQLLSDACAEVGGSFSDVLLPNLFGEHGRPRYNSVVATFAHLIARGESPTVIEDRELPLLHAQKAAEALVSAAVDRVDGRVEPSGTMRSVSSVLRELQGIHDLYSQGELPDLSTDFAVDLFNTYRSFAFPELFPIHPAAYADERGRLFETVRMHGGTGQAYVSTTKPGMTRGEHYHLRKFERFVVVSGEAEIKLRKLFSSEVVTFRMSGDRPGFVDMPTMWVHNITNVGSMDLVTMFWSDQLLDRENPDQFPERVEEIPA